MGTIASIFTPAASHDIQQILMSNEDDSREGQERDWKIERLCGEPMKICNAKHSFSELRESGETAKKQEMYIMDTLKVHSSFRDS